MKVILTEEQYKRVILNEGWFDRKKLNPFKITKII